MGDICVEGQFGLGGLLKLLIQLMLFLLLGLKLGVFLTESLLMATVGFHGFQCHDKKDDKQQRYGAGGIKEHLLAVIL